MPFYQLLICILAFIIIFIGGFIWLKKRNRANWFATYWGDFEQCLREIETNLKEYAVITSFESGYLNFYKLKCWKSKAADILSRINNIPSLYRYISEAHILSIEGFEQVYHSSDHNRKIYNEAFVKFELEDKADYLQTVLSKPLDMEQRNAIVADEDCNLIVAGAGCGKTTTVSGKVKYLIDRYKVDPSEIVLISFTRKSSQEMDERIRHGLGINVKVQTFHSMGLDIIGHATDSRPDVIEEKKVTAIISSSFAEQRKNEKYLSLLNEFFIAYLKIPQDETKVNTQEDVTVFLKDNNITSLKEIRVEYRGNVTIERQFCRSHEEVLIANFLHLNQIEYEYEPEYIHNTSSAQYRQYKPDFYLTKHRIYIEHYGVDKKNNVPKRYGNSSSGEFNQRLYDDANKKYKEKISWADDLHAKHKTILVKTFSWENTERNLLRNLEEKLTKLGVEFRPLDAKEVWAKIAKTAEEDVSDFELLIKTFFTLLKSNHKTVSDVKQELKKSEDGFLKRRSEIFIELFEPIYNDYEKFLSDKKIIDFNDMINRASKFVQEGKYNLPVKYILVDEFQDISFGRYNLLKSLLNYNPGCKIFCVGDDWQSIFRFTGSDISLFTDFEKYFGVTKRSVISTTYRFNEDLIRISSNFVQRNPNQIKKSLSTKSNYNGPGVHILKSFSHFHDRDANPIKKALDEIVKELNYLANDISTARILILGRYHHDKKIFENNKLDFSLSENRETGKVEIKYNLQANLNIQYMTIHAAKGLEADYVILLNCNSGKYGLPSERSDDPILNLLLSNADQFENGEERRLFYVALTRTKRKVYLITSERNSSKFIKEINQDVSCYVHPSPACDDLPF